MDPAADHGAVRAEARAEAPEAVGEAGVALAAPAAGIMVDTTIATTAGTAAAAVPAVGTAAHGAQVAVRPEVPQAVRLVVHPADGTNNNCP